MAYESNISFSSTSNSNIGDTYTSNVSTTDDFKTLDFLPEVFHSAKLKNFFDGTVEQLFSSPNAIQTSEFIGRKDDVYFSQEKDNYKIEKTKQRGDYQLEPSLVIRNPDSLDKIDAVFYTEALNHVSSENGKTNNQNRLFDQKYYSYAPPIDYDKFINYENYYWYPSVDPLLPSIVVTGSVEAFTANASQTAFTLSYPITSSIDVVSVNGTVTADYETLGLNLEFANSSITLSANDTIDVVHKVSPTAIIGAKQYTSPNGVKLSSGMLVEFNKTYLTEPAYQDKKYYVEGVGSETGIELVQVNEDVLDTESYITLTNQPWDFTSESTSGVDVTFSWDEKKWDTQADLSTHDYITIDRSAKDNNPWSRTNGWVHKNNITSYRNLQSLVEVQHPWDVSTTDVTGYDGGYFDAADKLQQSAFQLDASKKATRPIIEFKKNIQLYNYGAVHKYTVNLLATTQTKADIEGQSTYTLDGIILENGMSILFQNNAFETTPIEWSGDSFPWDHDSDGDGTADKSWDITGVDFDVSSSIWTVSGVGTSISLTKVAGLTIVDDDKITVKSGIVNAGKEYHWTGYAWILSQSKTKFNQPPLYNLYDNSGVVLNDSSKYSSSSFTGSKLFGYTVGTGSNDASLGFPLSYDTYTSVGSIKFKNYQLDSTSGLVYYKKTDYPNVLESTINKKIIVNPSIASTGNKFYIDSIEKQNLILVRGNKYVFDLSDSSLSTKGYSAGSHPFALSTTADGTHGSGTRYSTKVKYFINNIQVSETVFYGAEFNKATARRVEFTPDANTPNTIYYYCGTHAGMGSKLSVVDNANATLTDSISSVYDTEWVQPKQKSKQLLEQNFNVDDYTSANTFVLESLIADDSKVKVYVNNVEQEFTVDYNIEKNQTIKMTTDVTKGYHVFVVWDSFETKDLKKARFQLPKNLSHNALNNPVDEYSYSDLLSHMSSAISRQEGITGKPLGNNTYRDTKKLNEQGQEILQHSAPLVKFLTHVNSNDRNAIKSVRLAQDDYVRFKNKFLQKVKQVSIDNDITSWTDQKLVDTVLESLNTNKKVGEKWAYSLMANYGKNSQTQTITITSSNKTWNNTQTQSQAVQNYQDILEMIGEPGLDISYSFNPRDDKDTKSLYIYNNDKLLTMNNDYVIENSAGTRIVFIGASKPDVNDVVKIYYFSAKQPAWIPSTPSKLGMTTTFLPREVSDASYSSGTKTFIEGHDGSLTLKFNDDRDRALLEIEKRIYNDIENRFMDPDYVPDISYNSIVDNYFNKKDYSYREYTDVITPQVHRWAVNNQVDIFENTGYDQNDWKTWNWSSTQDLFGHTSAGHWRGIYKKFYGSDKLDTHPWEMLGFSVKPYWWDRNYNWTQTSARAQLIDDIEKGIIREGSRANLLDLSYTDQENIYRHEGFSSYVPVDTTGKVINPFTLGLVDRNPTVSEAKKNWKIGDNAPSERAYYINSASSFGRTAVMSVLKPAEFYEKFFDTLNSRVAKINATSVYDYNTGKRPNNNVYVDRETVGTNVFSGTGYQQYVTQRLINENKSITNLYGGVLRNVQPQLAHKQGAFVDFASYKAQTESYSPNSTRTSVYIPNNNISHVTHASPSIQNTSYSGVIVEKTNNGFAVRGYDISRSHFKTTVSDTAGINVPISVGGVPSRVGAYVPNQTLEKDQLVRYEGNYYRTVVPHVTDTSFVAKNFVTVNEIPTEGGIGATYYKSTKANTTVVVPYGTEFKTSQEVFDFLVNYGRHLESEGWLFDEINNDASQTLNWLYSAKEFLFWSIGGWGTGSVIALSPSASKLKFKPKLGVVANIEDIIGSTYSILDKTGSPIDPNTTTVIREGSAISVTQDNREPIYFVNLYVREIEHITIFDNETTFLDTIYNPTLSIRQPRIKQTLLRTNDWSGKLEANGYLIDGTKGLVSNFETSTNEMENYLDVDKSVNNQNLNSAGLHTIGYQNRSYLDNLEIVDDNQTKFYQGFIRQKGTKNAIDKITRSTKVTQNQNFNMYEYYAFKVGEFGGSDVNQSIEFKIDSNKIKANPQLITFLPKQDGTVTTDDLFDNIITIDADDNDVWVKKPKGDKTTANLFTSRTESFEMPTAGYVHANDTTYQVFDKANLLGHYQNNVSTAISLGSTYWVAKDTNLDWNVYRLSTITQTLDSVVSNSPLTVTLNESAGKLATTANATVDYVLPNDLDGSNASVITTTHGSKKLQLQLSDQSISKTITFGDFGGANAEIVVDSLADQVAGFVITTAGTGYSVGDTITVSGSGGTGASGTVSSINGSGGITGITFVNGGAGFYAEPADIVIKTGGSASSGSGAVINLKGNNPTFEINSTLQNAAVNFSIGETVNWSGGSAIVTNAFKKTSGAVVLHIHNNTGTPSVSHTFTGATSGAITTGSTTVTARSSSASGDTTFGGILTYIVNAGGTGYVSPSFLVSGSVGVGAGAVEHSAGVITSAYSQNPGYGYRKEFTPNADITITVQDTITNANNKTVTFADNLLKCDSISNVSITINEAWDGTAPQLDVGTSANPDAFKSNQALSGNVVITSLSSNIVDRSNTAVKVRFHGTNATTGNATVTVNYKKATYNVLNTDGTSTDASAVNTAYLSSNPHPIYVYKDVRLATRNNGIDQGNIGAGLSATVNDFVSNVCASVTFTDGDQIWIDNGGDTYWYNLKLTSNATVKTAYDNLASNANVSSAITIGGKYWIINSDIDYTDTANLSQTLFDGTVRTNKGKSQVDSTLFYKSKISDLGDYNREIEFSLYDPIKNLIPAIAEKEIVFKRLVDPAVYTNHVDSSFVTNQEPWGIEQVGKTWWNTSTLKYFEYENYDLEYKQKYWSKLFPGSTIDIYEWTESSTAPASYVGDGTPASTTNYSSITTTDKQNFQTTKYYFWVKDKTTVPDYDWRSYSTTSLSRIIKDPTAFGLNWYAPVDKNSLIVANSTRSITDDSLFTLNYKTMNVDKPSHKQWLMIKENDPSTPVDKRIWNKFTDSLSGKDASNLSVPDTTTLGTLNRYGSSIRPRQTWFKDVKEARRHFAYKLNDLASSINMDVDYPEWESGFNNSPIYDKSDYYLSGYSNAIVVNRTVDTYSEIDTSLLADYEVVKVNTDYNNKWAIYIYGPRSEIVSGNAPVTTSSTASSSDATVSPGSGYSSSSQAVGTQSSHSGGGSGSSSETKELVRIANQTSTFELNSKFYTNDDVSADTRNLMKQLYDYVFAGTNRVNSNELLFAMINYVFAEQENIDWVIKTSYFDVVQDDASLTQLASYTPDTFDFVKEYVNEAKPYSSKLVNYLSKKQPVIESANVDADDSFTISSSVVFDRVSENVELLSSGTDGQQLAELKKKRTVNDIAQDGRQGDLQAKDNAVERVAKYFFPTELAALDTADDNAVKVFMATLKKVIAPYNDLELEGFPFGFDKLTDSELVSLLGLDITGFDQSLDWDSDVQQIFYNTLFESAKHWQTGTAYTKDITMNNASQISSNTIVKNDDLTHFTTWSVSNNYDVGAYVKHQGLVYRCNVKHNAVDVSSFDFSKWDYIKDLVYITSENHTSGTFATDYASNKWTLITTKFDAAGFVRPKHEDNPEELVPTSMKENLTLTVTTAERTALDVADIDGDGNVTETYGYGDQYTFRIFYSGDGHTEFKRLPKVAETTLSANIDATVTYIDVADASTLYAQLSVKDPDDNSQTIGTIPATVTGTVNDNNPGYIWINQELIEFRKVAGNRLSKIRRGVHNTPIQSHTANDRINSANDQHDIPNATQTARWSAFDPAGSQMIDKTVQATWDAVAWDATDALWDKASLDPTEQAIFIRAGGNSNFKLYNSTYTEPGYVDNQAGISTGYFSEE